MKSGSFKKSLSPKKLPKTDREQAVLIGVIELYLKTAKPIGSHTLQENGFESLSSATIRNYFSKMEEAGLLKQPHISGGRIPTEKGLRLYVDLHLEAGILEKAQEEAIEKICRKNNKEIATFLHRSADALSEMSKCAVFVSMPRFDQDFIQQIRLIRLSPEKILSILLTDFGLIRTETIYLEKEVDPSFLHTTEEYLLWRLSKGEKPFFKDESDLKLAQRIYNEIMVRHVVGYANFVEEDVFRTGLSKLLSYPEFNDAAALASSFSLLEDKGQMRGLLRDCAKENKMSCWIGSELYPFVPKDAECAVLAIPYRINQAIAGAIALLGPLRLPYRNLFGVLQVFGEQLSKALTESVYKYKITFTTNEIQKLDSLVHPKLPQPRL